jgi:TolB-like protein/DNA-binding winged helix-turn-helix (wHTH) protein/Flp pilus assembly protein TadD
MSNWNSLTGKNLWRSIHLGAILPGAVASSPSRRFAFGAFEADAESGQLRKNGLKMRLDHKALQVLVALLERPGEVVSREELRHRLWTEDVFVDFERNLNNAVNRLREVLGDSASSPRFIETVPRKGYRFIGAVELVGPAPAPPALAPDVEPPSATGMPDPLPPRPAFRVSGRLIGATLGVLLLAAAFAVYLAMTPRGSPSYRSIVVLPFDGGGGDPEATAYLAFAISDSLTTELSRLDGLTVVSTTSARRYKEGGQPLTSIAQALNVDAVVEGSVFQDGERLQLTVQLIDGATDRHIWAQTYQRQRTNLVALLHEVTQTIAEEIHLRVTPQDEVRLASRPTVDPDVQEAFLQGQYYLSKGTEPDRTLARGFFERALTLDPDHAPSHSGLANAYLLSDDEPPEVTLPLARTHAARALEIDDAVSEAHASLGFIRYYGDWDWVGAERALRTAIDLDPSNIRAVRWYARVIGATGRTDEALAHIRRAVQLDPVSIVTLDSAAAEEFRARQHDRSLEIARRIVALDPLDERGYEHLATNFAQLRAYEDCRAAAGRGTMLSEGAPHFLVLEAYCLGRLGQTEAAGQRWQRLEALAIERHVPPYFMAIAAIGMERLEEAIGWLQRGFVDRDAYMVELRTSPWLDAVRGDDRVQELLRVMAFPSLPAEGS